MEKIRNFCIIAHIDHGKSTIADRMMELTGTVEKRKMKAQLLDSMELEREKGITIKLAPVTMKWKGYTLNLIDTPGHVDFSYEVSRSLQAVEIAVLVVDATQGIQAQTLANVYLALEQDLTIIPVINKIDLPAAEVEKTAAEIMNLLGCSREEIIEASGKTGVGVDRILDAIIAVPQGGSYANHFSMDTLKAVRPSLRSIEQGGGVDAGNDAAREPEGGGNWVYCDKSEDDARGEGGGYGDAGEGVGGGGAAGV